MEKYQYRPLSAARQIRIFKLFIGKKADELSVFRLGQIYTMFYGIYDSPTAIFFFGRMHFALIKRIFPSETSILG
ncbi:uncharacterized protein PgNI_12100 [Pyricularia grisea]|uniref:Uncharacterized protein n=1 Tax=Pyricularia grisea TaxID=148305 RepID=A0A6P8AQA6_PYRGI|nr:uncharacterized protein PgNI_12100 [Pyricularia grisea]TLD04219.1 hypothetical protein PgNI_12100 [Pyricularia grisea]